MKTITHKKYVTKTLVDTREKWKLKQTEPVAPMDQWINLVTKKADCVSSNPAKELFFAQKLTSRYLVAPSSVGMHDSTPVNERIKC